MAETARTVDEHEWWCVREHTRGSCSEKRGHWDRSTNTWTSDLTEHDRELIAEALELYHLGHDFHMLMEHLRQESREHGGTLGTVEDMAILTWNMTQHKHARRGESWPVAGQVTS